MNSYRNFVSGFSSLVEQARSLPLGHLSPAPRPTIATSARNVLFFSPHPDDECISGGMALRVFREMCLPVTNVAVTLGSNKDRQLGRLEELRGACNFLGYDLLNIGERGLEKVTPKTRDSDAVLWAHMVQTVTGILTVKNPYAIFFPHEEDWNGTHIGVHHLIMDALRQMPFDFGCYMIETEFWGAMEDPNLMVEISEQDLADLIAGTSFHVGEVERNPYHLSMPAWMMDNVRRGAEIVGGQGGVAPNFKFAALYRLQKWFQGQSSRFYQGGKQWPAGADIGALLA